ncbi:MAG: TIGR00730 family Rossman fold protein [Anderseniella sp.]
MSEQKTPHEQVASPSFTLPTLDQDFLLGDSTRGIRFMLEYMKAEEHLRDWGVRSTIVAFGSARVKEDDEGKRGHWYRSAKEIGRIVSERGGALHHDAELRDNVIATGGGPGIMEAANKGAFEAGAPSIGFNITLPHEQDPNAWSTPDLTFNFHYFAMRKMHLAMRANGLVVFPGGFGTMDELFEILTLVQTGKMPAIPIILFDRDFWTGVVNLDVFIEAGTISPGDVNLFHYAETAEEAWDHLVNAGILEKTPLQADQPSSKPLI